MKLLISGLDTIECAYYLRPGASCGVDFEALRAQREVNTQWNLYCMVHNIEKLAKTDRGRRKN